jgi:hypothetical protein
MSASKKTERARAGYSGKPLYQKLGLAPGLRAYGHELPAGYFEWLELPAARALFSPRLGSDLRFIHAFIERAKGHDAALQRLAAALHPQGSLWISWLKGGASDFGEAEVRAWALAHGLVDVKVCAVSERWSGLKCVRRKAESA